MTQKRMGFAMRAVVTLIVTTAATMAQTGGGATLVGTVKDGTGAAVAQASVTVVNTATVLRDRDRDDWGWRLTTFRI